jgi:glycosyltransferase involved in cell wall biosynthesis
LSYSPPHQFSKEMTITMKIMFVCSAEQMKLEIMHLAPFMAQFPHEFIISPLVRFAEKAKYKAMISNLGQLYKNIVVDSIYLQSPNMGFSNLLNPIVLLNDSSSILNVIRRRKPDSVVCYYLMHAYPFVLLKKIFGFSLAAMGVGSDVNLDNSPLQRKVRELVCRNSDLIFAASWSLRDKIEREYGRDVIVIPSSADSSFFRPLESRSLLRRKWDIAPEKRVILYVSRFHPLRAIDLVIKSLLTLPKNVILVLAGEGELRQTLEQLAISLGLRERVIFLGFRKREEIVELYNLADVFLQVGYSEGIPRALVEGMACECIPIVTKVGSMPEVVSNCFNGFIINPGDSDRLVERIKEVFSLSEEQKRLMQTRARHTVKDDFDSLRILRTMIGKIVGLHMCKL